MRGRILRDPSRGPGLLALDGRQVPFRLEATWRSDEPPVVGMLVDVELAHGIVVAVTTVPVAVRARDDAAARLDGLQRAITALAAVLGHRIGGPTLLGVATLVVSWCTLPMVFVTVTDGSRALTLRMLLAVLHAAVTPELVIPFDAAHAAIGPLGVAAAAAIVLPLASAVWQHRRRHVTPVLPLVLMLVVTVRAHALLGSHMTVGPALVIGGAAAACLALTGPLARLAVPRARRRTRP